MENIPDIQETFVPKIEGCVAVCPLCGSDLYQLESGCECKNPDCSFKCNKCIPEDELMPIISGELE